MPLQTSLHKIEAGPTPALPLRRARHRRRNRRGWTVIAGLIALLLTAGGSLLAYANTLPTSVTLNVKNGQKDVATDERLIVMFSRPVALGALQSAFSIAPAASGVLSGGAGQTQYAWAPAAALSDLTSYTVTIKPLTDVSSHHVKGGQWTFTTTVIPRIVSVTANSGEEVIDDSEIQPGSTLTIKFNDAMDAETIKVLNGTQAASLKWAADYRSASISTSGMPSGPLTLQMAPGGRDQSGHRMLQTFSLKTGLYYRDREHTTKLKYPALIQVPNDSLARDQNGLQAADVVFEYLAEGGITRCTAIFQNAPDLVGPMRSSRFISLKIARHYRGLLFQSGESQATRARAASDPVPQFFDTFGYTFRTAARYAPDNLMISGPAVAKAEAKFPGIGAYTLAKARPKLVGGSPWPRLSVDEHYSIYSYDPAMGTYQKSEEGHAYFDKSLKQPLRIEMVIVLHTSEWLVNVGDGHGAHIHDYDLDTGGVVEIYYKGQRYRGAWKGGDKRNPLTFTVGGQPVTLPPGLVWIDVTA